MGRRDRAVPVTAIPGGGVGGVTYLSHIVERTPDQESGNQFVKNVILDKSQFIYDSSSEEVP